MKPGNRQKYSQYGPGYKYPGSKESAFRDIIPPVVGLKERINTCWAYTGDDITVQRDWEHSYSQYLVYRV